MTLETDVRNIIGVGTDVISDAVLETACRLGTDWCADRARAYGTTAPESAMVCMSIVFLRHHLDLAGIKPSSISMPDLSMSTDLASACRILQESAETANKSKAYANGMAVRHIRSGKVPRWQ